jgi:acetolactate synthase-1/2/3 large subunit
MAQTIVANGITTIYGIPGIQNDAFFSALFDLGDRIKVVHPRHEQAAAYMALGAAVATGRPSMYCVVPGPGLLNTTAALATAYACGAPVFCFTGQIQSGGIGKNYGLLHEIPDQLGVLRGLTKWADRVDDPADGPAKVSEAFRQLRSGRPRPVGLETPPDVFAARGPFAPILASAELEPQPIADDSEIERAADLLNAAERPMIFVGSGAMDCGPTVRRLAEKLGAPVVANRQGRGILDERHPLAVTHPAARLLWKDCDVVLGVGSRLSEALRIGGVDDKLKIIKIDIDPDEISRIAPATVGLVGDARPTLDRLERLVKARAADRRVDAWVAAARTEAEATFKNFEPQCDILQAIRDVLPEEGIFVDEFTQIGYVARAFRMVYRPRTFISSGYQGTLGYGFATALGAQHARPDVPVVSVCGDGGFMFALQELATAVQHRIPLVTIVMNDGAYGNVRRIQEEEYGNRVIASDLVNPDFVRLAESFGVMGLRVRSPAELRQALGKAFAARVPVLIDFPVGKMPSPWPYILFNKSRG